MQLPQSGDRFEGEYVVEHILGEGGFARVYAATEIALERPVAIKILTPKPDGYDPRSVARFMREAQTVASLGDPHTLKLYSFGRTDDGLLYMVFERLGGEDLTDLLTRRGRLDEAETLWVMTQVLRSLREAHAAGILHRDIKPGNVRVFEYMDDSLRAKLLDFGIAKSIFEDEAALTRTGSVVGTPRFMSPEQLFGRELTPASDLYSVGLLAYDMLLGLEARGLDTIGHVQLPESAPVRPATRQLVNRLLAPDESQRFRQAGEVLDAIERIGSMPATPPPEHAPAAPPPPSRAASRSSAGTRQQPPALEKTNWRPWLVGAMAALVAIVLALTQWPAGPSRPTNVVAPVAKRPPSALLRTSYETPPEVPTTTTDVEPPATGAADAGDCTGEQPFAGHGAITEIVGLRQRSWPVYIPPTYDAKTSKLVVLIHDQADTGGEFIRLPDLIALSDRHGFVMFAPEDDPLDPWHELSDLDYVVDGIRAVSANLCIAPDRIFAIGHGRGATLVERLACEIELTAIAQSNYTSKRPARIGCDAETPLIMLAGAEDPFHPIEGGQNCTGKNRESWQERVDERRSLRGCSASPDPNAQKAPECTTWSCRTPLVSCVAPGGHNWFTMGDRLIDTQACENDPARFDYAGTIWRFFERVTEAQ